MQEHYKNTMDNYGKQPPGPPPTHPTTPGSSPGGLLQPAPGLTAQFLIHGIFNNMGLLNTRLVAWANCSAGQAVGIHGVFNYMVVHPNNQPSVAIMYVHGYSAVFSTWDC